MASASRASDAAASSKTKLRVPRIIRLGSDCSGLDTAAFALKRLGARYVNKFASDALKESRKIIELAHCPENIFVDMMARTPQEEDTVDIYVWTPPCQDISIAGKHAGFKGKRQTGALVARSLAFVKRNKPRVTVLEQVPMILAKKHRSYFLGIVRSLESSGYRVNYKLINAHTCMVPQSRTRLILVGIRLDSLRRPFQWPHEHEPVPANDVLEPFNPTTDKPGRLPVNADGATRAKTAMSRVFATGQDPRIVPVFIDVDCSEKFSTYGINVAKTITRGRGGSGGPWVSSRGRRVTTNELFKLQGFDNPADIPWEEAKVSKRQVGQLIGNSVCLPVMGMVLSEAMYAAGLTSSKLAWHGHATEAVNMPPS